MSSSIMCPLLALVFVISALQAPAFALQKSYIVYLGSHSHGPETTLSDQRVKASHYRLLESVTQSLEKAKERIFYSYTKNINGFAAVLDDKEASALASHPEVLSVFLNRARSLHTTRSWTFMGLEDENGVISKDSLWNKARFGKDVIIGNLDTGIWPESESFSDKGLGPIPSKWKGTCQRSRQNSVNCNRKLIGVRYFNKGFLSAAGDLERNNDTYFTARDVSSGHGTHTLSTAGGSFVPGANILGHANGTAKGGSPNARVAAYRVCWPPVVVEGGCYDADILAGFDAAISDGVDVLSISLGRETSIEFHEDSISIGAFHAVKKDIVVVASAGNSGPNDSTVANVAPWILTVGASTLDRNFVNAVALGNKNHLKGTSLAKHGLPEKKFYPLITGSHAHFPNNTPKAASYCLDGTLDPKKVKGKILLCIRGTSARLEKGRQALRAGAVGMILANDESTGNELFDDPHFLPSSHVNYTDGQSVLAYINSTKNPVAYLTFSRTVLGTKPNPKMVDFSSRGPNFMDDEILKPDITAPGVSILAAFSMSVPLTEAEGETRHSAFNLMSGTSMSCPHVAGIVGLLKTLYPHWSPAAIKSAIVTTGNTLDNNKQPILDGATGLKANPFQYGSGHVNPNSAMDPGLVYDLSINDHLNYLCARGYNKNLIRLFSGTPYSCPKSFRTADYNYPSISVTKMNDTATVTRRVKNVGTPGTYKVYFKAPKGVSVSVNPQSLKFEKIGEEKKYKVSFKASVSGEPRKYEFGELTWTDGKHYVKSPLVIKSI